MCMRLFLEFIRSVRPPVRNLITLILSLVRRLFTPLLALLGSLALPVSHAVICLHNSSAHKSHNYLALTYPLPCPAPNRYQSQLAPISLFRDLLEPSLVVLELLNVSYDTTRSSFAVDFNLDGPSYLG